MYSDDELFDVLTEDGTKTGLTKRRGDVHRDGDWHGSVHIWVTRRRADGLYVLLQKRADDKDSYPGCFDAASTGHLDAGEDPLSAAVREIHEEIGIFARPSDFVLMMKQNVRENEMFNGRHFVSNEVNWVYLYNGGVADDDIECEAGEVSAVSWQKADDVLKAVQSGNPTYCVGENELRELMRCHDDIRP